MVTNTLRKGRMVCLMANTTDGEEQDKLRNGCILKVVAHFENLYPLKRRITTLSINWFLKSQGDHTLYWTS